MSNNGEETPNKNSRVYKIDVGNIDDDDIEEYVRNIAKKFKQNPDIKSNFNFMEDEEYFLPVKNKKENKMEKQDVYKRIDCELDYQDSQKFERQSFGSVSDEEKPVAEWINYMEYHLSKAKAAVYHLNKEAALEEVRKVTALGVRTMMIHGCPARKRGELLNPLRLDPTTLQPRVDQCSCDNCDCKKPE